MSELFTQNYSDKPLFHTDTDISESLHNQVDETSNGEELLDSTEKQAESLLSNDDYVSETKDTISDDSDDAAENLSSPADGNRKYITGTNTPRASRSNAYYELLCNQQTNGHRSPACAAQQPQRTASRVQAGWSAIKRTLPPMLRRISACTAQRRN